MESDFAFTSDCNGLQRPARTIIAQLLFSFASGGGTLSEAALLREDPLLLRLLGVPQVADEATLRTWLKTQSEAGVGALRQINSAVVEAALQNHFATNNVTRSELSVTLQHHSTHRVDGGLKGRHEEPWNISTFGPFVLHLRPGHLCTELEFAEIVASGRNLWHGFRPTFFSALDVSEWTNVLESKVFSDWSIELQGSTMYNYGVNPENLPGKWEDAKDGCSLADKFKLFFPPPAKKSTKTSGRIAIARRKGAVGPEDVFLFVSCQSQLAPQNLFTRHSQTLLPRRDLSQYFSRFELDVQGSAAEIWLNVATLCYNILAALRLHFKPEDRMLSTVELIRRVIGVPARESDSENRSTVWIGVPETWPSRWITLVSDLDHELNTRPAAVFVSSRTGNANSGMSSAGAVGLGKDAVVGSSGPLLSSIDDKKDGDSLSA